jgi:hypothetical protein
MRIDRPISKVGHESDGKQIEECAMRHSDKSLPMNGLNSMRMAVLECSHVTGFV